MDTKQSLTESQLAEKMFAAINNDEDALNDLFSENTEIVAEAPETPPAPDPEDEEEDGDKGDGKPPEGTPPPAKPDTPPVETPPVDDGKWIEKVPEDLRPFVSKLTDELNQTKSKAQYFEQRLRSDDGRVAAYQRKADELERKYKALTQQKPQNPTAALNIESDDDFKQLLEADPHFAKAFKNQIEKVASHLESRYETKFKEIETQQARVQQDTMLERETALLIQAVPQAENIMTSDLWEEFKEKVPPGVRRLAESNDHRDVVTAIQMFGNYLQYAHPEQAPQIAPQHATATPPAAPTPPASEEADAARKVVESRQRRLASGAQVPPTRLTSQVNDEVDSDRLAAKFYEQIRKEQGFS